MYLRGPMIRGYFPPKDTGEAGTRKKSFINIIRTNRAVVIFDGVTSA